MAKKNSLNVARANYERALAESVRVKNPATRIGTARPKRVSQITKKHPTKRLVTRRLKNTAKGYFPNPVKADAKTLLLKEYRLGLNAVAKETDDLSRQATLSYSQGIVQAGQLLEIFSDVEAHSFRESLRKSAGIRL